MLDALDCLRQGPGHERSTLSIVLHQMVSNALRGFRPDPGQTPQRLGQEIQAGWVFQTVRVIRMAV
jgi:hypothetical protein